MKETRTQLIVRHLDYPNLWNYVQHENRLFSRLSLKRRIYFSNGSDSSVDGSPWLIATFYYFVFSPGSRYHAVFLSCPFPFACSPILGFMRYFCAECQTIFDSWIRDDSANRMQNNNEQCNAELLRIAAKKTTLKWKLSLRASETKFT